MRPFRLRRVVLTGLTSGFVAMTGLASAQDGRTEFGPPVTTPKTDKNRATPSTFVPPRVGSEVLTPVPATASDPAPPGTRVERVDLPPTNPATAAGAPSPDPTAAALGAGRMPADVPGMAPAAALPAGVLSVEGLITGSIQRAGKDLPDEQVRIRVDPTRNWAEFTAPGSVPAIEPTRNGSSSRGDAKPLDLAITRRTALYTFSRTPDGRVVSNALNPYAPDNGRSRTGLTPTGSAPSPLVAPTNFTVLRPGQFVAAQYRNSGNVNEATALAVIVVPTVPATGTNTPAISRPIGVSPASPDAVGTGRAGLPAAGTGVPATPGAAPTTGRIPRIPNTPVAPGPTP